MRDLNLPNLLTLLRIVLVPVMVLTLLRDTEAGDVIAAVVFVAASATDMVDGYLARAQDSITTFGKLMDPIADKLLIIAALVALVSLERLAAWVAVVIVAREVAVTVTRMRATRHGVIVPAISSGKLKTLVQVATILALILSSTTPAWLDVLVYVAVAITVLSGIDFLFGLRRRLDDVRGEPQREPA